MSQWISGVFQSIGIGDYLAIAALVVSAIVGSQTIRISKAQARIEEHLATLQIEELKEARARRNRAELRGTLTRNPDKIRITNRGGSAAYDVRIAVEGIESPDPINALTLAKRFPIKELAPEESVTFSAMVLWELDPLFRVSAEWREADGQPGATSFDLHPS